MLRFVMPILRKAAIQINFYFSRFSKATSGKIYVALFNFRAILCRQEVRFNLEKEGYLATERQYFRYFVEEEQNWNTYSRGLISRSQRIGRDYFLDRILFSKDDLIVDCGANVGDLYLYFQINKIPIRYIGIEPSTHEFNCLQLNVSNQECYNFGLWNMSGNLPFYYSPENADSSFTKPLKYNSVSEGTQVVRLDSVLSSPVRLLKLEAEGSEIEVLEGTQGCLSIIEYISADVGFERGPNRESTLAPVTNFLLKNNFELLELSSPRRVALFRNLSFLDVQPKVL